MLKSLSFFVICAVAVFICFEVLQNPSKTAGTTNIFEPLSKKSDPSYLEQTDSAEPSKIVSSNKLESNIVERYRQEIEAPILEAIRAFESKDRIIISDREFGPDSRSVILEIPALNTDEIAHLHGLISTGLERLPNEVRHRASEIALKYVNSSTAYPARYKFIQLVVPSDPAKGAQMFEVYSNDRKSGIPNTDGVLVFDLGVIKSVRRDPKFGEPTSWSTGRYGHLFELSDTIRSGGDGKNR